MSRTTIPRLAAIRIADGTPTDYLLEAVARSLQQEGKLVAGFLQRQGCQTGAGHAEMLLEDILSGQQFRISQSLGRDARGCRLDPTAVADISGPFLGGLDSRPDLLVINRFGKSESEGQGFRAVLETAFLLGIPVLTAVKQIYGGAWDAFADNCAVSLPPVLDRVLDWSRTVVAQSQAEAGEPEFGSDR
ncbi:DUF2478 domain-containing protein [Hoeflea sp. YIM 152468]|uniref:DUF2478 domain-containing protein n=1 Tax=Hoeflea sp. YIM 152468 TaxID=3031759 RepID=UPI0023DA8556|nr:DUF2478 domain-containing protein [Hoeflea sp. YIM 152468]MDF1606873.1 DUF2478 domain-containing protein [Hoeflea sp. YIM 152468]